MWETLMGAASKAAKPEARYLEFSWLSGSTFGSSVPLDQSHALSL